MKTQSTIKIMQLTFALFFLVTVSKAQLAKTYLDINDVSTLYNADGRMFFDPNSPTPTGYNVPKNHPKKVSTMYSNGMLIGAKDAAGSLHTAGMSYSPNTNDFWPGPLNITTGEAHDPSNWNRIWSVKKSTIDYHKLNYQSSNYVIPQEIASWPGNGPEGCSPVLAPFFDKDGDGLYEPAEGDYPKIKGDQAIYFIINDNANQHTTYPGGLPLKVEVHGMAWAKQSSNKFIDQATFLSYAVFNRSTDNYYNVRLGFFTDFDLGNPNNDYISSDTTRNMVYVYNQNLLDDDGVSPEDGALAPVQALVYLDKKMGSTMALTDQGQFGVSSDPRNAVELHRYLNAFWADGQPLTYGTPSGRGGTTATNYIFDGDLCVRSGWNETQITGERRVISSTGIDTLKAGGVFTFDLAFVYARGDSGIITSECKLQDAVDFVLDEYHSGRLTGLNTAQAYSEISVFPNPVADELSVSMDHLNANDFEFSITDLQGRVLMNEQHLAENYKIDTQSLQTGMYILQLKSKSEEYYAKFVVK